MGALVSGALGLLGGIAQGDSNKAAAQTSADAQLQAARIAADASKFRPVGVTNAFGGSNFGYDSAGNVNSASYTLDPQLAALVSQLKGAGSGLMQQAGNTQQAAKGLFSLGQQYIGQNPQDVAAKYIQQQQALLKPQQDIQYAALQEKLANTGRGGLSIAQGGNNLAANPEMAAYYNAKAQQEAQLAADAQKYGQAQTLFGKGLLDSSLALSGGAYAPLQNALSAAGNIDALGRSAFDIGSSLGGKNVNTAGASALMQGGLGAAQTMQKANEFNPWATALQGLGSNQNAMNAVGGWFSNMLAPQGSTTKKALYSDYGYGSWD